MLSPSIIMNSLFGAIGTERKTMLNNLDAISEGIRSKMEARNAERERLITTSRVLTRHCANAIRAMPRQEWDSAQSLLATAHATMDEMHQNVEAYADLHYAGYTQDSFKEYVEAALVFAIIRGEALPGPRELNVEEATYLNGIAEAASELHRYVLDILRREHNEEAERRLTAMATVSHELWQYDFSDA